MHTQGVSFHPLGVLRQLLRVGRELNDWTRLHYNVSVIQDGMTYGYTYDRMYPPPEKSQYFVTFFIGLELTSQYCTGNARHQRFPKQPRCAKPLAAAHEHRGCHQELACAYGNIAARGEAVWRLHGRSSGRKRSKMALAAPRHPEEPAGCLGLKRRQKAGAPALPGIPAGRAR